MSTNYGAGQFFQICQKKISEISPKLFGRSRNFGLFEDSVEMIITAAIQKGTESFEGSGDYRIHGSAGAWPGPSL